LAPGKEGEGFETKTAEYGLVEIPKKKRKESDKDDASRGA
jgi:hypothetical protein